mmetsp:Transcript_44024/g.99470  ORF Transcript_44024/g.99470 Transcript_44024/m.99470 type:complete len:731 (-) Transcript_44024:163-2355(-)
MRPSPTSAVCHSSPIDEAVQEVCEGSEESSDVEGNWERDLKRQRRDSGDAWESHARDEKPGFNIRERTVSSENDVLDLARKLQEGTSADSLLVASVDSGDPRDRLREVEMESESQMQLLREILPEHIVQRLLNGEHEMSQSHESVSIIFSDIVNWTNIAQALSTKGVVKLLNTLFSAFDELTDEHMIFKVETIGDAYMAASGHDGAQDHALRCARFGLAILKAVQAVPASFLPDGHKLQIRVGIHTGPAHTGVVGRKVPRYCFFGDTVNTASRMESHGVPGCVHLSESTAAALREAAASGSGYWSGDDEHARGGWGDGGGGSTSTSTSGGSAIPGMDRFMARFMNGATMKSRGMVKVKGKGKMPTFVIIPREARGVSLEEPKALARNVSSRFEMNPSASSAGLAGGGHAGKFRREASFLSLEEENAKLRSQLASAAGGTYPRFSESAFASAPAKPLSSSNAYTWGIEDFGSTEDAPSAPLLGLPTRERAPFPAPADRLKLPVCTSWINDKTNGPQLVLIKRVGNDGKTRFVTNSVFEKCVLARDSLQANWEATGRPSTDLFLHPEDAPSFGPALFEELARNLAPAGTIVPGAQHDWGAAAEMQCLRELSSPVRVWMSGGMSPCYVRCTGRAQLVVSGGASDLVLSFTRARVNKVGKQEKKNSIFAEPGDMPEPKGEPPPGPLLEAPANRGAGLPAVCPATIQAWRFDGERNTAPKASGLCFSKNRGSCHF